MAPSKGVADHPLDVLTTLLTWTRRGKAGALVVVAATQGGAVRSPGALMAVPSDGQPVGYVSGGCIDADVVLQARQSLKDHRPRALRYGEGSQFVDLKLPCGGAIEIAIFPRVEQEFLENVVTRLTARMPARLAFDLSEGTIASLDHHNEQKPQTAPVFNYLPKLHLRVAGRGADALTLTALARTSGLGVSVQSPDEAFIADVEAQGLGPVTVLTTPDAPPDMADDRWTAFVLLFHDLDWEVSLLQQALGAEAFYIGAVGSRRTHERRIAALRDLGVSDQDISRIHGPIGLIPAMRDASMLAVSTLAEVVAEFHRVHRL